MSTDENITSSLQSELKSFQNLWKGGYWVGDPLDPMGFSDYGTIGYLSILHVIYLTCIKPYMTHHSVVLEIGPGRGAWTKTFLNAKEIWCLDALSAEHNGFWSYLGCPINVKYFQVQDFSCDMLPEDKFDYLFSFGCFCHISFEGITEYVRNLYPKLQRGAHCFIMIADYDRYNRALDNIRELSIKRIFLQRRRYLPLYWLWKLIGDDRIPKRKDKGEDDIPSPGRWYHAGVERTCEMLEKFGYKVIAPDVGIICRDPIIHFKKE